MKQFFLILLIVILTGSLTYGQLNKRIDRSQKSAILNSPFSTAKGMKEELSRQKRYRLQYLNLLTNLMNEFPNDTILLKENYDFICFGCPADYVQIQIDTLLITFSKNIESKNYTKETKYLTKNYFDKNNYFHSDLFELKIEIRKSDKWNSNPKKYGTDQCFDGGHTFYTVLYPDKRISSMYMRCWINKEMRK